MSNQTKRNNTAKTKTTIKKLFRILLMRIRRVLRRNEEHELEEEEEDEEEEEGRPPFRLKRQQVYCLVLLRAMQEHSLVYSLRDDILELLSQASGHHHRGHASAARNSDCLSAACRSQLIKIDCADSFVRHITQASAGFCP
eukprot:2572345-Pyramimonas_sp.AAC.1